MKEKFPKADLFNFKAYTFFTPKPIYTRYANAGIITWLWFSVFWRMPYLPEVAWKLGYEAGFAEATARGLTPLPADKRDSPVSEN